MLAVVQSSLNSLKKKKKEYKATMAKKIALVKFRFGHTGVCNVSL